jgi:hypothetical protein
MNITHLQLNGDRPATGYWDQSLILDLLKKVDVEGEVVIIPGAYQVELVSEINKELNKLYSCVVMVMSDEESLFPIELLQHPRMKVWVQYPKDRHEGGRYLPAGYSLNASSLIHKRTKTFDWMFGGQVTHRSRVECVEQLRKLTGGYLLETEGFTQGMPLGEYLDILAHAKLAVCPNGTVSPDTMRLYDALEANCVPIVESPDFFHKILGDFPFPIANNWGELPQLIEMWKDNPSMATECKDWWHSYKQGLINRIEDDLWNLI